jgi:lipoate-protein ligase A
VEALTCRLLPHAVADGPHNMAADEALLESAAAGVASLRFYGWSGPTLTLGYFQPEEVRRRDPALAGLPWVRRPSGGHALVHHHELTYALALPPGPPWQDRAAGPSAWLCKVHHVIAAALASFGVDVRPFECAPGEAFQGVLCFRHFTPGDLLIGSAKVVGSAQRRYHGAWVQHGGILLATSAHAPALPGILELTGRHLDPQETATAVAGELERATGWRVVPGEWTPAELRRLEELVANKYSQPAWNAKR